MTLTIISEKTENGIECSASINGIVSDQELFRIPTMMGSAYGKIIRSLKTKDPSRKDVEEISEGIAQRFKDAFLDGLYINEEEM